MTIFIMMKVKEDCFIRLQHGPVHADQVNLVVNLQV